MALAVAATATPPSLGAASPAATTSPDAARSLPRLWNGSGGVHKPRSYCPANHTCFAKARWTSWTSEHARAKADARTQYPGGPAISARITFRFSAPRHVCGGWYFTVARWRHRGDDDATRATLLPSVCVWTGA